MIPSIPSGLSTAYKGPFELLKSEISSLNDAAIQTIDALSFDLSAFHQRNETLKTLSKQCTDQITQQHKQLASQQIKIKNLLHSDFDTACTLDPTVVSAAEGFPFYLRTLENHLLSMKWDSPDAYLQIPDFLAGLNGLLNLREHFIEEPIDPEGRVLKQIEKVAKEALVYMRKLGTDQARFLDLAAKSFDPVRKIKQLDLDNEDKINRRVFNAFVKQRKEKNLSVMAHLARLYTKSAIYKEAFPPYYSEYIQTWIGSIRSTFSDFDNTSLLQPLDLRQQQVQFYGSYPLPLPLSTLDRYGDELVFPDLALTTPYLDGFIRKFPEMFIGEYLGEGTLSFELSFNKEETKGFVFHRSLYLVRTSPKSTHCLFSQASCRVDDVSEPETYAVLPPSGTTRKIKIDGRNQIVSIPPKTYHHGPVHIEMKRLHETWEKTKTAPWSVLPEAPYHAGEWKARRDELQADNSARIKALRDEMITNLFNDPLYREALDKIDRVYDSFLSFSRALGIDPPIQTKEEIQTRFQQGLNTGNAPHFQPALPDPSDLWKNRNGPPSIPVLEADLVRIANLAKNLGPAQEARRLAEERKGEAQKKIELILSQKDRMIDMLGQKNEKLTDTIEKLLDLLQESKSTK